MPAFSTASSLLLLSFASCSFAVKSQDFKTCSQAGFCRRGRALADRATANGDAWRSPYSIDPASVSISTSDATFTAGIKSSLYPNIQFGLDVRVLDDGVVRVRMDEVNGLRQRYNEAGRWALVTEPPVSQDIKWTVGKEGVRAVYGKKQDIEAIVQYEPLLVVLRRNGKDQVVVNGRGLLHMEHFRTKEAEKPVVASEDGSDEQEVMQVKPTAWFEGDAEDAYWEETFSSWTDSKPKGMCQS